MSTFTLNLNGKSLILETGRGLSGGVSHQGIYELWSNVVSAVAPNVAAVSANDNTTVNLVSVYNCIRPFGTANSANDSTTANLVINFPVNPTDGQLCVFTTTAAISNVTGTVANAQTAVPTILSTTAGGRYSYRWQANANVGGMNGGGLWLVA